MRALFPTAYLLLLTALGGCVGSSDPAKPVPEDPNQFTYKTVDYPYAVRFAAAAEAPAAAEMQRLQDFLHGASARPEDKVTISSDNSPLGKERADRIRAILKHAGLETVDGVDVNLSPDTVALVLTEKVAVPPKCGEWPVFAGDAPSNAPSLYLGCALRNNLYQQVVDKRDLAVGRTPGPADAEPSMRAVQKYREGLSDKKGGSDDSPSAANAAAESATGAAEAAATMANPGGSNGSSNGQ
ncbi:MAG TPA: CpaD family pilus assembly lipoprotein [Stellaceae bacterium]|nr:CpaD family pilus assembly lipoprotein [Stellaceae bacterium]